MSVGFRLDRQHLKRRATAGSVVEVARHLCGLHAQVMSSADLQLRARVQGHAPDDLPRALWQERTVVKTWLMRGTLHIVPADDLPLFTGALDNRGEYAGAWLRAFGVTAKQMEKLIDGIAGSLDGDCLTREELVARVEPRVGRALAKRLRSGWGEFLKPAARRGVLCFGPSRGQKVTFVRPDQWVNAKATLGRDEARTELLRRFLGSYGPATRGDFQRWLGSQRTISEAWAGLANDVVEVSPKRFALAADVPALRARPSGVHLLPGFDPFVLFPHSERPVPDEHLERVYRKQAWISATVVALGRVIATWTHAKRGRNVELEIDPFEPFAERTRAAVEREARSVARHVGGDLQLTWR
jgi:winged helix DNA-binding protein